MKRPFSIFAIFAVAFVSTPSRAQGLAKADAEALLAKEMTVLREAAGDSSLPKEMPKPIHEQILENEGKLSFAARALSLGDEIKMPFVVVVKDEPPLQDTLPLFISMHGGGADGKQPGPHTWEVNTREFQTQVQFSVGLYKPEGIYFIPRMADDRLGRWWHRHNQKAFDQVIDHAILHWNVDPNRIYLMGVSEGGYGTDILGPFMADRWAGANAMAAGVGLGNPPANLRNVAFRTDVGEKDMMFDRKPLAVAFHEELDRLHGLDPQGYSHSINVQEGRGHGLDYSQGIEWIVQHVRNPWPKKLVWINQVMHGLRRDRFYWIAMPEAPEKGDLRIDAAVGGQTITLEVSSLDAKNIDGNKTHGKGNVAESKRSPMAATRVDLLLSDSLLDLEKPVTVMANGKEVYKGLVERSAAAIKGALSNRPDPSSCPTAVLTITTP